MSMIKVQEMVAQMRLKDARGNPRSFSIIVATADRQRKTGGRMMDLQKVILLTKQRQSERLLNVQMVGSKDAIKVHLDLILYFNNQEVI